MLPPDTSSNMVSWRGLIFLLQVYGWFPYRISTLSAAPVFSLPLCLWSIFLQIFVTALCGQYNTEIQKLYVKPEVGIVLMMHSTVFLVCGVYITPLVLTMKSNKLAALMHDLSQMKSVFSGHTRRWYCQVKLHFDIFIIIVIAASATGYSYITIGLKYYEVPLMFYWATACCMSFFLSYTLFAKILDFLSSNLMAQTKTTVAVVSPLLTHVGSFNRESDLEEALLALHDLDAIVREVEIQKERATRFFFPIITMFLLEAVFIAVASPYAMKTSPLLKYITFFVMLFAYYVMGHYCYLGQSFVNQISTTEGLLKDLRMKSRNPVFCMKVNHVIARLAPLLTFDMGGWYTLSYSSFLVLMNTILTYVVIILQVGGTAIPNQNSNPSSNANLSSSASEEKMDN